jgi:AcrR family transcriptional regulator
MEVRLPRATAEHAAEVRQRILDGADRAFSDAGFRGTSIPDIAGEAGVSVGLIYRYFPSKEELFLSVCQHRTDAQLNSLAISLGALADPADRLRAGIGYFVESLVEEGWGSIVIHALAEADRNPRLRDMLVRLTEQLRGFATMFIREAIARGEAPADLDVEAAGLAAAMLLHGAIVHQAERGASFDPDEVTRAIAIALSPLLR